jgi:hypothetical protein
MGLYEYRESRKLFEADHGVDVLIMAAMRKADDHNLRLLRQGWPELWDELEARYHLPGGMFPSERAQADLQRFEVLQDDGEWSEPVEWNRLGTVKPGATVRRGIERDRLYKVTSSRGGQLIVDPIEDKPPTCDKCGQPYSDPPPSGEDNPFNVCRGCLDHSDEVNAAIRGQ